MNQAVKAQWVAALRSGKYSQCTGRLHCYEEFDVLGVLCSISELGKWGRVRALCQSYLGEVGVLPKKVVSWAGLLSNNPLLVAGAKRMPISAWNDQGLGFVELAEMIENQL